MICTSSQPCWTFTRAAGGTSVLFSHNAALVSRSQLRSSPFFHVTVEIPRSADEQHGHESQSIVVGAFIYFFHFIFSTFEASEPMRVDSTALSRPLRTIK